MCIISCLVRFSDLLNFLLQFRFEIFHRPGDSSDMVVADILSRMVCSPHDDEETMALKLERPVLREYEGPQSPILMNWFRVEPATKDDVIEVREDEEREGPRERISHLPIMLKRLQKETDREEYGGPNLE